VNEIVFQIMDISLKGGEILIRARRGRPLPPHPKKEVTDFTVFGEDGSEITSLRHLLPGWKLTDDVDGVTLLLPIRITEAKGVAK
jgi:hypothetical protein